jgi:hypothetical protein
MQWPKIFVAPRHVDESMWNSWWTKRHWDKLFSEFFGFSVLKSFHSGSIFMYKKLGDQELATARNA